MSGKGRVQYRRAGCLSNHYIILNYAIYRKESLQICVIKKMVFVKTYLTLYTLCCEDFYLNDTIDAIEKNSVRSSEIRVSQMKGIRLR